MKVRTPSSLKRFLVATDETLAASDGSALTIPPAKGKTDKPLITSLRFISDEV
jgi:hypothetical protein